MSGNKPKSDMASYLRRHLGPLPIVSITRFVSANSVREDDEADCDGDGNIHVEAAGDAA